MRHRATFRRWAWLWVLWTAVPAVAQTTAKLPPETIARVETIIHEEMTRYNIPGMSVAIAVDNELVYASGFGLADLENSVPAKGNTVYRTASIAKPMTAVAVLQLAEQGQLDLDAPIQKYCPAFPAKQWPVTARQLLGHLGGVRHYTSGEEATGKKHYFSLTESLELFKDEPLLHQPGTKFRYTTYGFTVLGCALEGASGRRYEDYMAENVWGPAGMSHTRTDDVYSLISNRAHGYLKLDEDDYARLPDGAKSYAKVGGVYNASLHDTSMKVPGGGLVSTAADLAKFALAVNTAQLLKKETVEQMWARQKLTDGTETSYGLGWFIGELNGMRLVSHGGGQAGTSTFLALFPEKGLVVAVMSNLQGIPVSQIARQIGEVLLPPPVPAESKQ